MTYFEMCVWAESLGFVYKTEHRKRSIYVKDRDRWEIGRKKAALYTMQGQTVIMSNTWEING